MQHNTGAKWYLCRHLHGGDEMRGYDMNPLVTLCEAVRKLRNAITGEKGVKIMVQDPLIFRSILCFNLVGKSPWNSSLQIDHVTLSMSSNHGSASFRKGVNLQKSLSLFETVSLSVKWVTFPGRIKWAKLARARQSLMKASLLPTLLCPLLDGWNKAGFHNSQIPDHIKQGSTVAKSLSEI